jgi:transcriptional regulator with XRE-family HTH domain
MGRPPKKRRVGRPRKEEGKLSRWLDAQGMSRYELAARLDIARPHVDRICRGVRRPSLELAIAIEKLTDGAVPAASWISVPKHSSD